MVEVFIKGERLDLHDDESINVKQVTQDLKDISKLYTDYSQTFNVPASRKNNRILKNWFNADIDNGFDARTRVQSTILLNTIHFKTGKIRLDGADIEDNQPTNYKLTFFGNVIQIKDLVGEDQLSDLEWLSNFNHAYNGDVVKTGLTQGLDFTIDGVDYDRAIVYPLISYKRQWYYNSHASDHTDTDNLVNIAYHAGHGANEHGVISGNLKPAIQMHLIIKAIQEKYGLDFNSPFFDSNLFKNIYVNLNKETESLSNGYKLVEDIDSTYDVSSISYARCGYEIGVVPKSGFEDVDYYIKLTVNGQVRYENTNPLRGVQYKTTGSNVPFNPVTGDYTIKAEIITNESFEFNTETTFKLYTIFDTYTISNNIYSDLVIALESNVSSSLPDIKVYDFLTNIIKIFNLIATAEGDSIYIQDLQSWYSEGQIYDVTKYIDLKTEKLKRGTIYKDINFTFEESDQILANQYEQSNNEGYGDLEFKLTDENGSSQNIDGDTLDIEAIFENPMHERLFDLDDNTETTIQYTPYFDQEIKAISGNMFMFYADGVSLVDNPISFINDGVEEELNSVAIMPSHSYNIASPSFNLNFNSVINEYTYQVMPDTIYQRFYDDYITDIFSIKRRMYTIEGKFPDFFLNKLKLNDRLIIKDRRYLINSITSNLVERKDTLELINDIYEAPLASDTLNTSVLYFSYGRREPFGIYSSQSISQDILYVGLSGMNTSLVDTGDGYAFIDDYTKVTTRNVDYLSFKLEENTTGIERSMGIKVEDGINNPIFYILQEA